MSDTLIYNNSPPLSLSLSLSLSLVVNLYEITVNIDMTMKFIEIFEATLSTFAIHISTHMLSHANISPFGSGWIKSNVRHNNSGRPTFTRKRPTT